MMNQEIKAQWVKALRSGKYAQARGYLSFGDRYCCLGVLCDILAPDDWSHGEKGLRLHRDNDTLPDNNLREEIGLLFDTADRLACMNDGTSELRAHSFTEIADWIEENL